jgi:hypothetical protein
MKNLKQTINKKKNNDVIIASPSTSTRNTVTEKPKNEQNINEELNKKDELNNILTSRENSDIIETFKKEDIVKDDEYVKLWENQEGNQEELKL